MKSGIMKKSFIASALLLALFAADAQPATNLLVLSSYKNNIYVYPGLKAELGSDNIAEISWHNVNTIKVLRYELEKSSDATHFSYVTSLPCGNNAVAQYIVKDRYLFNGNNYYRLKIVGAKGNYSYTNTVSFSSTIIGSQVKVLSSAADKELLVWTPANTHITQVVITDMMNRSTFIPNDVVAKTNLCSINVSALKTGLYKLALYTNEGIYSNLKFSKK